jgi:hypothetical protein
MTHSDRRFPAALFGFLLLLAFGTAQAVAQGGLKTIDPPQGGKIVYGQVLGQSTEAGAMGAVLKSLHTSLGDKPQVGKLFQVHGTESIAAFFSVNRRIGGSGQIAGLLIVAKVSSDHVEAALVSDEASRFPRTLSPMMKTLFDAWHPMEGATGGSAQGPGSAAAQLHQITLSDRSASIGLPDGWQVSPQSAMGTIMANGPNGENASLGLMFLASDTNNPHVQQTMRIVQSGGLRNTVYANGFYYPYGGDMTRAFVDTIQNTRRKAGLQPAKYNFSNATPLASNGRQRCIHLEGTVDFVDGKGLRELNAVYCTTPPTPVAGVWTGMVYAANAPMAVAANERATLAAILQSFNVNMSVVQAETAQIAGPAIEHIHAIGRAAAQQAASAHEREDIHNSSVYQHWDSNDKRSQEFENYQLGMSVVSDTGNNAHGTFWNEDADALVKSNPDRFEYVSAPDYWKGIDY